MANNDTHIIYPQDNGWIVESKNGAGLKRSFHTSKTKAFYYFIHKHPGKAVFVVAILPQLEATIADTGGQSPKRRSK